MATGSGYGQDTHMAVVKVPDERLGVLTEMFEPRKTTPAEVQYTDFPGVGFGSKERSEAAWVGQLRTVDALVQVVRTLRRRERPPRRPHRPRGRRREGAAGDDRLRPGDRRAPAAATGRGLEADADGGTGPPGGRGGPLPALPERAGVGGAPARGRAERGAGPHRAGLPVPLRQAPAAGAQPGRGPAERGPPPGGGGERRRFRTARRRWPPSAARSRWSWPSWRRRTPPSLWPTWGSRSWPPGGSSGPRTTSPA